MKRPKSIKLLIATLFVFVPLFQNCTAGFAVDDLSHSSLGSEGDFFNYPYSQAPAFYKSAQLFMTDEATRGLPLGQFTIVATVASVASSTASIDYDLTIKTPNGQTVCSEQMGTLASGTSKIQFSCVAFVSTTNVIVNFVTVAGGVSNVSSTTLP